MIWLLAALACVPFEPFPGDATPERDSSVQGDLSVSTTRVDFGELDVVVGEIGEAQITVRNTGSGTLVVAGMNMLIGDDEAFVSTSEALLELSPGASEDVTVFFIPPTDGEFETALFPNGETLIELRGSGSAPVARLIAEDAELDPTALGCARDTTVSILNDGRQELEIEDFRIDGSDAFSWSGELPEALAPGAQVALDVAFNPTQGGTADGSLRLTSNDPADPEVGLNLSALGVPGESVQEDFTYLPGVQADILFVVDGTMSSALANAQDAIGRYFEALEDGNVDWQATVANGDADCSATYEAYLTGSLYDTPSTAGPALAYGLNPTSGGTSALLELATATLERSSAGECLSGFLREGAQLHVVLMTNRTEASPGAVESYLELLASRVEDETDLVVSAVIGLDSDGGCQEGGAARDAAESTGGVILDICNADWESFFSDLADVSVLAGHGEQQHPLSVAPVPSTLELSSGGQDLSAWHYDEQSTAIVIEQGADLDPGDDIRMNYTAAQACD